LEQELAVNQGPLPDGKISFDDLYDIGFQPFIGLTFELNENMLLGLVYRAEADTDLEGDATFKNLAVPTPAIDEVDVSWDNPQWLEAGLRLKLSEQDILAFNVGWQDWSVFSENRIGLSGGAFSPTAKLDRKWKDTWHAGIAYVHQFKSRSAGYSIGTSYDSSPVSDKNRTIDFPVDETIKLSAYYFWKGPKEVDFAVGATLMHLGQAKIDQTSQGVRFTGDFDSNIILMVGTTLKRSF
jgi:long-chain fatty acid transport protein